MMTPVPLSACPPTPPHTHTETPFLPLQPLSEEREEAETHGHINMEHIYEGAPTVPHETQGARRRCWFCGQPTHSISAHGGGDLAYTRTMCAEKQLDSEQGED